LWPSLVRFVVTNILICLAVVLPLFIAAAAGPEEKKTLFREDFNDLKNWEPLNFESVEKHTSYTIESAESAKSLKAESNASASALVYKEEFNVYEFPKVRWRWKVENVYKSGKAGTKEGDDYPIRVYVMFKYEPRKAGLRQRIAYAAAKLRYGEYPPHSSLNYIWANREQTDRIITSPYTDKVRLILKRQGTSNVGEWVTEEIDIVADYEKAFGKKPPPVARIAIMNDSDNTGERSVSYVDYIEVRAR
jgi:hypothetical protein